MNIYKHTEAFTGSFHSYVTNLGEYEFLQRSIMEKIAKREGFICYVKPKKYSWKRF